MAGIESWVSSKGKQYRIRLSDTEHPDRPRVSLGKVTRRQAESVKVHVEHLIACKKTGTVVPPATQAWLTELPDSIRKRLEDLLLVASRKRPEAFTIEDWTEDYMVKRTDIKPNTRRNMEQARSFLLEFIPNDLPLADFTEGHAEDFRRYLLEKGQAESTVRRRCKRCKQFFMAAKKRRIIEDNPFDGIPTANVANSDRQFFIDRSTMESVLDACPDSKWRLIFALARYGGLRIPSELEHMTWEDVGWLEADRFTVRSPKTAHIEGKAQRSVPMFAELVPHFQAALNDANLDQALVFPVLGKRSNLRTQAHRIIRRAGLEPWERVFQNLRSSRETELVEEFPVHVVTDWIGNSPDVAKMHYLQTHEEHFRRAAGQNRGTDGGLNPSAAGRTERQCREGKLRINRRNARDFGSTKPLATPCGNNLVPPRGLEPLSHG